MSTPPLHTTVDAPMRPPPPTTGLGTLPRTLVQKGGLNPRFGLPISYTLLIADIEATVKRSFVRWEVNSIKGSTRTLAYLCCLLLTPLYSLYHPDLAYGPLPIRRASTYIVPHSQWFSNPWIP